MNTAGESAKEVIYQLKARRDWLVEFAIDAEPMAQNTMLKEIRELNSRIKTLEGLTGGDNDQKTC